MLHNLYQCASEIDIIAQIFLCGVHTGAFFSPQCSTFSPGDIPHAVFSTHDAQHVAYPGILQTYR